MIVLDVKKAGDGIGLDDVNAVEFSLNNKEVTGYKLLMYSDDDATGRGRNLLAGLEVTGVILSSYGDAVADNSVHLAEWSKQGADSSASYRNVTVKLTTAGQVERQYDLLDAFVASYQEYFDENSDGRFKLVLRQRRNRQPFKEMVAVAGGF